MPLGQRGGRVAAWLKTKAASRLASLSLVALAGLAGWSVWPHTGAPKDAIALAPAFESNRPFPATSPAFILDDSLFPHQCGRLLAEDGGAAVLAPYGERQCQEAAHEATAVVYGADVRLLWAMLTEAERAEISATFRETAFWLRHSLQSSLTEPFFDREYRPLISDILRSALERTLQRPNVREALQSGIASVDPQVIDTVLDGIVPVVLEKLESSLWSNLRSLAGGWLGGNGEATSLGQVMVEVANDPRVRNHLHATLPRLMASPGLADAAVLAASEFMGVLIEDPRIAQLVQRLLTDRRIAMAGGLGRAALPEGLPRKLLKLRSPTDHNPLSAYVVRLAMHGRAGNVLLLLRPDQYARLSAQAGSGIILSRAAAK